MSELNYRSTKNYSIHTNKKFAPEIQFHKTPHELFNQKYK